MYIADLHLHSHYSRATSKNLNLETLYEWAQIKGINIIGTGDFTHPEWFKELQEKLIPDGNGFFKLKKPPLNSTFSGINYQSLDVRFCLSSEVSCIYKYADKVRKNHHLLYAPNFETVAKINSKLSKIGNLKADGRPILGLSSRNLLEIVLESSKNAYLIPAHIWTPWFSTLGSKAGYDSIEECFRDLSDYIFALETGLSSDPAMNWKISDLDKYTLISNSDAHSPQKLGREANVFDVPFSYDAMFDAIKTKKGFLGTLEFFPEEGKYHMDGHRNCNICLDPQSTLKYNSLCPKCGKLLTIGVLHRVNKLSNRKIFQKPNDAPGFEYIIPLPEIISEIENKGVNTKTVQNQFQKIISTFGNEFFFLREVALEDIKKNHGIIYYTAIKRLRKQEVIPNPGYDGVFGKIQLFKKNEIESLSKQLYLFN